MQTAIPAKAGIRLISPTKEAPYAAAGRSGILALDYLDYVQPTLIYLASPYAHDSASVREARLEAVRHVCGKLVNEGKIVLSPMVYTGELAQRGFHPPQGWYAWDLQFLARADELLVLQLPGWEQSKGVLVEIAAAQTKGIPVRLMALEEAGLPAEILEGLGEED